MEYPFDGIRVIDAASFLAAPGAATVLADFGADVIKVEPLSGDGYRTLAGSHPVDYNWQLTSRNKRGLALDLGRPEARMIMHDLIRGADVLIVNLFERQLARFGLDYATVQALNPRLVYAHMSGYGTEGADAETRAFDSTAWWARTGLMDIARGQGVAPAQGAPGFGDHSTAMALFGAIAMALYRRERTGEGGHVASSLLASGAWANGMQVQGAIAGFDLSERRQRKGWVNPFSSVYGTADGRFVIFAIPNAAREWPRLCEALGHPEWLDDPRFVDVRSIMRARETVVGLIQAVTGSLALDELVARLRAGEITFSVVNQLGEVIEDPQLLDNGILVATDSSDPRYRLTVSSPVSMRGARKRSHGPAPEVGEHSREILRALGRSETEIDRLVASGVVGVNSPQGAAAGT